MCRVQYVTFRGRKRRQKTLYCGIFIIPNNNEALFPRLRRLEAHPAQILKRDVVFPIDILCGRKQASLAEEMNRSFVLLVQIQCIR
jgi:hypothetical protein